MSHHYYTLFLFCFFLCAGCSEDDNNTSGCEKGDFLGVWNINGQCSGTDFQNQLTITELTSGIRITNLDGGGANAAVDASVVGSSFTIAPQTVLGYTIVGNGTLNAGCAQLTISWQGGPNGNCAGTGTK